MNINAKSISKVLSGKRKKAGGYTFRYSSDTYSTSDTHNIIDTHNIGDIQTSDIQTSDATPIQQVTLQQVTPIKVTPNTSDIHLDNASPINKSPIQKVSPNACDTQVSDTYKSDSETDSETSETSDFYKNLFYQCINDFNKYRDAKIYPLIDKAKLLQQENEKLKEQRNKVITSVADDTTINELKEIIESQNKEITKLNNEYDLLMQSQGNGEFLKKKYRQQRDENKKMVQELISMKYVVEKAKEEVQEAIWGDFTKLEHEDLIKENLEMKKRLAKYEDVTEFKTLNYMNLPKEDSANVASSADTADIDILDKCLDDIANDKESNLIKDVKESVNRTSDLPNNESDGLTLSSPQTDVDGRKCDHPNNEEIREISRTCGSSNSESDSATLRRPNNDEEVKEMTWSDI